MMFLNGCGPDISIFDRREETFKVSFDCITILLHFNILLCNLFIFDLSMCLIINWDV